MKQSAGRYHYAPSRRRWGQNFLCDRSVADRIVAAIDPDSDDLILEIGPGEGVLTEKLAHRSAAVVAVEIDPLMASLLQEGPARRCPGLTVLNRDALEVGPGAVLEILGLEPESNRKLRLAGNLPFNVAVPLIRQWVDHLPRVKDMTFMVQLEVAQRMTAVPSTSAYGFLSLVVQSSCSARTLFDVGRAAFRPKPNVDAAVIRLQPLDAPLVSGEERRWLLDVVSMAFRSRRKTLFNNLRADRRFAGKEALLTGLLDGQGLDRNRRGESLGLEEFVTLARQLAPLAPREDARGNDGSEKEEKQQDR